ncbi:hypothetical protein ACJBQ4_11010, partial [Streptococcus suis]
EGQWRWLAAPLCVTIAPWVLWSGAIGLARRPQVISGATNKKLGAAGSLSDLLPDERLSPRVQVGPGRVGAAGGSRRAAGGGR